MDLKFMTAFQEYEVSYSRVNRVSRQSGWRRPDWDYVEKFDLFCLALLFAGRRSGVRYHISEAVFSR
jgi:hypothetical protein